MIKAIIFDLGGVVVNIDKVLASWIKIFKVKDKKKFWQEINHEMAPLCRAEISEMQFWKNVAERFGTDYKKIPKNLLTKDFRESIRLNSKLLELISKLRKKYKIAVISNIIQQHSEINKDLGLYENFHQLVLSYEVKMTKDSKEIFALATRRLKVKPQECIFIDDIEKFVNVAKSYGMNVILFKDNRQLKKDLEKLLK